MLPEIGDYCARFLPRGTDMRNEALSRGPKKPMSELETAVGHVFERREFLTLALTHSSHVNENGENGGSIV